MPLRLHYASAIALISAEPEDKRLVSARDLAIFSYANIANVIRKVSPYPQEDRHALFAQMVLNICVHNTDDHLKNFGFLEPQAQAANAHKGLLALSPCFDIVTQTAMQHYLSIGTRGREGSIENALTQPHYFGLSPKGAKIIAQRVIDVVANRRQFYDAAGLSEHDQAYLNALVETRCLASHSSKDY